MYNHKKYEDNYVLSSLKVYSTALVFVEQLSKLLLHL